MEINQAVCVNLTKEEPTEEVELCNLRQVCHVILSWPDLTTFIIFVGDLQLEFLMYERLCCLPGVCLRHIPPA